MDNLLLVSFVLVLSQGAVGQRPAPSAVAAIESKADLLAVLRSQEASIQFVTGKAVGLRTGEIEGEVADLGETVVSFLRDGHPAGRSLLDYERTVLIDTSRSRTYTVSRVRGFDGRVNWALERTSQGNHQSTPVRLNDASISHERGIAHASEFCTGWCATMPGFYEQRKARFSDVLEREEVPFELSTSGDGVVLSCRSRRGVLDQWELSREWAYCLRRYSRHDAENRLVSTIEVSEAEAIRPNFYYPTHITFWWAKTSSASNLRLEVSVDDVKALDTVDADAFAPRFPHGTSVTDRTTGETVTVSAPDGDLQQSIDEQADTMRGLVRFDVDHAASSGMMAWLIGSVGVLIAFGLTYFVWRHRSRRNGARAARPRRSRVAGFGDAGLGVVMLAALILASTTSAQVDPSRPRMFDFVEHQSADNCGLNVLALCCAYFGKEATLQELASQLGCGQSRVSSVSLERISLAMARTGLSVVPFHAANLDVIHRGCVESRGVAIVHAATGAATGHYYLVAPAGRDFVVADPARRVAIHEPGSSYLSKLASSATGYGLLVSPGADAEDRWDLVLRDRHKHDVGEVGDGVHVARIAVRNGGAGPIALLNASSSCGCFASAALSPESIEAGSQGFLVIEMDGSRVGVEPREELVQLQFQQPGGSLNRRLVLVGYRAGSTPRAKPAVVPSLVESEGIVGGAFFGFVEVLVPDGGLVAGWDSSEGVEARDSTIRSIRGGVAVRYKLTWKNRRNWIVFRVRDHEGKDTAVYCGLGVDA